MKIKLLIFLTTLTFTFQSFSCDCDTLFWMERHKEEVTKQMESSDLIFLGELVSSSREKYEFKVLEVFKGNVKRNDIIEGGYYDSCSGRPHNRFTGKWIIYSQYSSEESKEETIDYSVCGSTRSLEHLIHLTKEQNTLYWNNELNMLNNRFGKKVVLEL